MLGQAALWVVYRMTIRHNPEGMLAVCEQHDWEAMELAHPGYHKLVRGGIATEMEAELLARGTTGDAVKKAATLRSRWSGGPLSSSLTGQLGG